MRKFTRKEAIDIIKNMNEDMEIENPNLNLMTNEQLEEELCLSGYIHDTEMGGVFD